jgi:ADP-ribose pyrophosphatase
MAGKKLKAVYDGKFIRVIDRNGWEYASRKNLSGIVGIIGVTERNELLLIEQFRPPINKPVIEIPAGLAGDLKGSRNEGLAKAARRELLEETGYICKTLRQVAAGTASAGICDEIITLFVATGLTHIGTAHGDGTEHITTHLIPLDKVEAWLRKQRRNGKEVDLKVYAALHWAMA